MKTLERTVAPTEPLITLAEAKAHLRVSHVHEDSLIALAIQGATDYLDGFAGTLGRALLPQTWRLTLPAPPPSQIVRLPLAPFRELVSVEWDDVAGQTRTIDLADLKVRREYGCARVHPAYAKQWPLEIWDMRVTYSAGYDSAALVPAPIRQAALLLIGDAYDNRAAIVEGRIISENPAVERLIAPYRVRTWD